MTCSLSFHLHVSEPISHMGTDNFIMKEQVTLIPLHFDVFVQIMITAVYIVRSLICNQNDKLHAILTILFLQSSAIIMEKYNNILSS